MSVISLDSFRSDFHDAGQVVQRYSYSSFGKIYKIDNGGVDKTTNPDIKSSFTYTNREYDSESGLYYYRARYYDPALGRFLTEDPHPGKVSSPDTFNTKYAYVANNPINSLDPSGEEILTALVVGALVGVAMNEIFDLDFSAFQAALIGAAAGFAAAELVAGVAFEGLGIAGKTIGAALFGAGGGILGAVSSTILLGMVTQNDSFKDNIDDAFYLGAGVGGIVGVGMTLFPNSLDAQIYGRINLIPYPLEYSMTYPGDVVGGALFVGSKLFCGGRELSRLGGESCGF
ncbi:MAG: RHS repeat-associated core domain-containing protein [Bacteriovoracaceae bacterium]